MRVESLRTLGFRNLTSATLRLGEGVTLLHGANGAGKTNLLEALYAGLAGRSCRTRTERETIAFGEPLARSEVLVADQGEAREFLYAVDRSDGKRHLLNGNPVPAGAASQRPSLAVFMPDRLALIKGPPAARRSHLDGFIAALRPARSGARARYARSLAQRNALLGRIRSGALGPVSLDAWDAELAASGIELMVARADAVDVIVPIFAATAKDLGLGETATIAYRPRSQASTAEELVTELGERRESDLARGFSGHGPHLDELAVAVAGRQARRYASQGQQRSALLALLFAERDALLADSRTPPLMLLDDVTSELDPTRRALLCERLMAGEGQALITATEANHLPGLVPAARAGGQGRHGLRACRGRGERSVKRLGERGRRRDDPHTLASVMATVRADVAPLTLLAAVQEAWPRVAGETVAAQADPVAERAGVITIACRSATWAQELDLMQVELLERLREAIGEGATAEQLERLRFTADAARGDR